MRVAVGSLNPVKRTAVETVFADLATSVDAVAVESGVTEQPFGHDETMRGAATRADRARSLDDYDLGVGLEGGVADVANGKPLFLVMWAAITDGDTVGYGSGPSVPLPTAIAARIRAGEELGPVMDDTLGTTDIAKNEGAAGALTGNHINRQLGLETALAGALGPFVTSHY